MFMKTIGYVDEELIGEGTTDIGDMDAQIIGEDIKESLRTIIVYGRFGATAVTDVELIISFQVTAGQNEAKAKESK